MMKRRMGVIALLSMMATGIAADRAQAASPTVINVTIGSPLSYVFSTTAGNDPSLSLVAGQTYQFTMTQAIATAHPFAISTSSGVEPPVLFNDPSVTGNETATVTFAVPNPPPATPLFYQCAVHSFMTNAITFTIPPPPVPALDGGRVAALAALLLAAGVGAILWQRRKRAATPAV